MATKLPTTATTIQQLKALGFSDEVIKAPVRLIASVAGREKTGKTHFACTAPAPIIFFNVDIGAEGVVGKFQSGGKQVLVYDVRVPRGATADQYKVLWSDLRDKLEKAWQVGSGTVILDTATEAWELARLAHFGKLTQVMPHNYVEVNNEWRSLLRSAYDSPMNTILIHKMKPKYVENVRTRDYEVAGFGETDYLVQINLITEREDNSEGGQPIWTVRIKDCRQNPNLSGQVLAAPMPVDFGFLLKMVHA